MPTQINLDRQYIRDAAHRFDYQTPIPNTGPSGSILIDHLGSLLETVCIFVPDGSELVSSFTPISYEKTTGKVVIPDGVDLGPLESYVDAQSTNRAFFVDSSRRYYQIQDSIDNLGPGKSFKISENLNGVSLGAEAYILQEDQLRVVLKISMTADSSTNPPVSFLLDGSVQVVTEDTVTPANNAPLPVKIVGSLGDIVFNTENLNLEVQLDGVYDGVENTEPDTVGIIAHERNATPGETHLNKRLTATQVGDTVALDVNVAGLGQDIPSTSDVRSLDTKFTTVSTGADISMGANLTADRYSVHIFNQTAAELRVFPGTAYELLVSPASALDANIKILSGTAVNVRSLSTDAKTGFIMMNFI